MIDNEFLDRVNVLLEPQVKEFVDEIKRKTNLLNQKNREKIKLSQKKYFESEKGKKAITRRNCISAKRFKKHCEGLSKKELEDIKNFYINRPIGMEVDHITPLSKGGKHHILNLQYLTKEENREKGRKPPNITGPQKKALEILNENEKVSTTFLQRKMKVSFTEAYELCKWLATCHNVKSNFDKTIIRLAEEEFFYDSEGSKWIRQDDE